jgi:hypothetical protein
VPSGIVVRACGSGQDELPVRPAIVDRSPDVVPELWTELPLVEQAWRCAVEHDARVDLRGLPCELVRVQSNFHGLTCTVVTV